MLESGNADGRKTVSSLNKIVVCLVGIACIVYYSNSQSMLNKDQLSLVKLEQPCSLDIDCPYNGTCLQGLCKKDQSRRTNFTILVEPSNVANNTGNSTQSEKSEDIDETSIYPSPFIWLTWTVILGLILLDQ
jgi:hypothetical protein